METINNIFTLHIPSQIAQRLEEDRISFLPGKSKSSFIVQILTNYYDLYDEKYQEVCDVLKKAIIEELHTKKISDYNCDLIVWKVYEHMEKGQLSMKKKVEKKERINIRLNSVSNEGLRDILDNAPMGANYSAYLTSILTSYLNLPKQEREKIALKEIVDKIERALNTHCKLRFSTTYGTYIANPIGIYSSKEELYNYFVYELDSDEKHAERRIRHVHIRNMQHINYRSREKSELSSDYKEKVSQMLANGVQFGYGNGTIYKVQLTENGIKQFNRSYLEQPKPLNDDYEKTGILLLNCSLFQLERYFAPFYNNAKILEPKEEADRIQKRLEEAYKQYIEE